MGLAPGSASKRRAHLSPDWFDCFCVSRVFDAVTGLIAAGDCPKAPEPSGPQRWGCHADRHAGLRSDTNPLIWSGPSYRDQSASC
jgi:hypothetical protein